jgi:hypothetical protein
MFHLLGANMKFIKKPEIKVTMRECIKLLEAGRRDISEDHMQAGVEKPMYGWRNTRRS